MRGEHWLVLNVVMTAASSGTCEGDQVSHEAGIGAAQRGDIVTAYRAAEGEVGTSAPAEGLGAKSDRQEIGGQSRMPAIHVRPRMDREPADARSAQRIHRSHRLCPSATRGRLRRASAYRSELGTRADRCSCRFADTARPISRRFRTSVDGGPSRTARSRSSRPESTRGVARATHALDRYCLVPQRSGRRGSPPNRRSTPDARRSSAASSHHCWDQMSSPLVP